MLLSKKTLFVAQRYNIPHIIAIFPNKNHADKLYKSAVRKFVC